MNVVQHQVSLSLTIHKSKLVVSQLEVRSDLNCLRFCVLRISLESLKIWYSP